MELIKGILFIFALYAEIVWNRIVLFFGATESMTNVFKIGLIVLALFLVFARLRPALWKWIILYLSEIAFFLGSVGVLAYGFVEDHIGWLGYGSTSAAIFFLLIWVTFACQLYAPQRKGHNSNEMPSSFSNNQR